MITKCANPECQVEFHNRASGRLFSFPVPNNDTQQLQFWLCDDCASRYSLSMDDLVAKLVLRKSSPRPNGDDPQK